MSHEQAFSCFSLTVFLGVFHANVFSLCPFRIIVSHKQTSVCFGEQTLAVSRVNRPLAVVLFLIRETFVIVSCELTSLFGEVSVL